MSSNRPHAAYNEHGTRRRRRFAVAFATSPPPTRNLALVRFRAVVGGHKAEITAGKQKQFALYDAFVFGMTYVLDATAGDNSAT